jgi:mannose-1-phosphate guanylyltransferase
LGYVVPGADSGGARSFVEKPSRAAASDLVAAGALWNTFIFAATGATLLALFHATLPGRVAAMAAALRDHAVTADGRSALASLYAGLPDADFSREVLTQAVRQLRLVNAGRCGWSDLGTPRRIGEIVCGVGPRIGLRPGPKYPLAPVASLACAYLRPALAV